MSFALELLGITKRFGDVAALAGAEFRLRPGTVHALLGENGAGKTTLMRLAFGMLRADAGTIRVGGTDVRFRSPVDALACGIGMVHQHFTLVPAMTVAENIALGGSGHYRPAESARRVDELSARTGLRVPARSLVRDLAVGAQQRVEILKALARSDVKVLILDEPTAVLAPAEVEELLRWVQAFARDDRSVILITHKLREATAIADDVTVLRAGRTVLATAARAVDERKLIVAMLGEELDEDRPARGATSEVGAVVLQLRDVSSRDARTRSPLRGVSLDVRGGELVGVAGVEGSGHSELLRVLAARLTPSAGTATGPADVAFIPEDRHRDAVILDFSLIDNLALRDLGSRRGRLPWTQLQEQTRVVIERFDVRAAGPASVMRSLSGGNQQKFIVGREFVPLPRAVVAENPTRGLDVKATLDVHSRLRAARDAGAAVVMYSSDVDEVLALADRVIVVHNGEVHAVSADREAVGRAMLGVGG